jgi:hypothetical protein
MKIKLQDRFLLIPRSMEYSAAMDVVFVFTHSDCSMQLYLRFIFNSVGYFYNKVSFVLMCRGC